jgi:hypothetical protein
MSAPAPAYAALALRLSAMRRRDLLEPLANALAALQMLALLIERAVNLETARRFKEDHMRQRAAAEHALFRIVEAVSDDDELVAGLLDDEGRLLADELLDAGEED